MCSIVQNFCWVQISVIFMDRRAFTKIKAVKNELSWMKIDDVIMCLYVDTN